jgi:hypothetical protein
MITSDEYLESKAAEAIRTAIKTLIEYELCTLDEFLTLIDSDYHDEWHFVSGEIARKAEPDIRNHKLDPNDIKPWQICKDYRVRFEEISTIREWHELHGALDTINQSIAARFRQ